MSRCSRGKQLTCRPVTVEKEGKRDSNGLQTRCQRFSRDRDETTSAMSRCCCARRCTRSVNGRWSRAALRVVGAAKNIKDRQTIWYSSPPLSFPFSLEHQIVDPSSFPIAHKHRASPRDPIRRKSCSRLDALSIIICQCMQESCPSSD